MHILAKKAISPSVESFYIQGFTDSDGDDEHNLALSQQRAFSVGRFVVTDVIPPSAERNFLLKWLYVNGRGEQEQLLDTRTHQENKQASRRVEVRIRVKSNEQRNVIASAVKP
ncbi:MAG: OmpA family protein [Vampirovibrio sp.]|nr:OmpA family protein [Vampirovibrio sp.]